MKENDRKITKNDYEFQVWLPWECWLRLIVRKTTWRTDNVQSEVTSTGIQCSTGKDCKAEMGKFQRLNPDEIPN